MTRERAGRPGVTWERELRSLGEVVVPDDDGSPFGWAEGFVSETAAPGMNLPQPPRANRATRRAAAKAARRNRRGGPQSPVAASEAPGPRRDAAGRSGGDEVGFNGPGKPSSAGHSGDSTASEAETAQNGP